MSITEKLLTSDTATFLLTKNVNRLWKNSGEKMVDVVVCPSLCHRVFRLTRIAKKNEFQIQIPLTRDSLSAFLN